MPQGIDFDRFEATEITPDLTDGVLGSPALLDEIVARLSSSNTDVQNLAVNAPDGTLARTRMVA